VAPNQVLNKEGMTMESCAVDFMQQFDMFVGAMCNRANEGIGIDPLEATLSTSYTEMMPNSSSCINPTPFDAICRLAGQYFLCSAFFAPDFTIYQLSSPFLGCDN